MSEFKNGDKVTWKGETCYFVGKAPTAENLAVIVRRNKLEFILLDQLLPYREPVKVAGWINVYSEYILSNIYPDRQAADLGAIADERIACVYVSGTEGVEPEC